MKILPHHVYRRSELWRQNFWGGDQQAIGKIGLRMHHLHPFFKNFLGETPTPPPLLQEDKNFPSGFIWSSTAEVKIRHRCVYRISELWRQKLHTIFWGKNKHELGKKWAQNAPFASIFLKFSGGGPPDPHRQEGVSPPAPSSCGASRRFGYAPGSGPSGSATEDTAGWIANVVYQ